MVAVIGPLAGLHLLATQHILGQVNFKCVECYPADSMVPEMPSTLFSPCIPNPVRSPRDMDLRLGLTSPRECQTLQCLTTVAEK